MSKIVVLSRRNIMHPLAGGASRYQHEIFRRLSNHYDVTILAQGAELSDPIQKLDGVTYVNLRGNLMRIRLPLKYITRFAKDSDVLIDHGDVALPLFSPLYARRPRITIIHQLVREIFYEELPRPFSTFAYFAEPALYQLYSRSTIVAASQSTARDLNRLGIAQERIRVVSPGCSRQSKEPVPLARRSQKLIGCVSRLMQYKGLQFAIKALEEVTKEFPDTRLEIAGTGPYWKELRRLADRTGMNSSVTFLGRVSEERKLQLYSESRAIVSPSIREGYGISIIEANSVGTPVVGWKVPGSTDSIIDNTTGLLANYPDYHDLARQIRCVMTNDSVWNRLSANAWKWANNHSWDRSATEFTDAIESALRAV